MIDVGPSGTSEVSCGRADATASTPRLASSSAIGRWRRQRDRRGMAVRKSARLEYVTAWRRRRRSARR